MKIGQQTGWDVGHMPLLRPFPLWGPMVWGRAPAANALWHIVGLTNDWGAFPLVCRILAGGSGLSRFRVSARLGPGFKVMVSV